MEIVTNDKYCIITPFSPKLDKQETLRIFNTISKNNRKKIGLNLCMVKDCTIDFLEILKNIKNICLFNIPSDIFALLNCMNFDKAIRLYASELDFCEDKHQIVNRKFNVIK